MAKYGASDPVEVTTQSVNKAIDSFKDLSHRLETDFLRCIELAKNLNAYQKDANFENFYKQFEPRQEDVKMLKEQMDKQIVFVEKTKEILTEYLIEGKKTI